MMDEYVFEYKDWKFDQRNMIATCPHGYETEIDGDAQDGCKSVLHEIGL